MTEIDPKLKGEDQDTGAETLEQMPDWNEHKEELEKEKSKEQRQVDDLEVLFSFCDEKDVLEILRSDDYGKLLDNDISLVDLFNANALFYEQYHTDGYTKDYEWRGSDDPQNVWHLLEIEEGRFHNDPMARVHLKKKDRDLRTRDRIERIGLLKGMGKYERANEEREKGYALEEDVIRAREAKETIATIANLYVGEDLSNKRMKQFKEILALKANGSELSEKQKNFLKKDLNDVADRLLYDGHVLSEERANNILNGLDSAVEEFDEDMRDGNESIARGDLVSRMAYAKNAIDNFIVAGHSDLVYKAQDKLAEMTDKYFDVLVTTDMTRMSSDFNRLESIDDLVFGYSNPFMSADRAKQFNLCRTEDGLFVDQYVIDDPDRIVDYIGEPSGYIHGKLEYEGTMFISKKAKVLKELGVSDEAILRNCFNLSAIDFADANSYYDGSGARLVEAGVDKKKIAKKLFIDSPYIFTIDQTSDDPYSPEMPKSDVEILEDAGFTMTEIAKASTPDVISRNLAKFLERGVDAKELAKYMVSYTEVFEKNITRRYDDGTYLFSKERLKGFQDMWVCDKNHPEGRMVKKWGMLVGDGIDFAFANLDVLAENGVTEEDILEEMKTFDCAPFGKYIPRLLEQPQFDKQKVMDMAYKQYVEHCKWMKEKGRCSDKTFKQETDPQYYYATIIEQLTEEKKKERDEYFSQVLENKE